VWREAARVPPQAAAAWPLLLSLSAGCASFYAGARHGVARGGTCASSGGGGLAVAAPARRGLRRLLLWRASRRGARRRRLGAPLRPLGAGCAGSYAGARHNVARGGTYAASGGGGLAVAALARRGERWLLGWRASRCGAGRHMCRLRRRWLGRCCARSARAAPASTLARVTVWRDVARMPPQAAAAASPSLRSLGADSAGSWAGARHGVARGGTCVASGGGGLAVAALARRGLRRSTRVALALKLARVTVWREVARVPPQAAAAWPLLRSLGAGCAGSYAGACHGVARGGTCAASGGGGLAVAAPARRGLRRLLRWRPSRCGARRHVCRLRRRWLGRWCACSTRVALALTLARVTLWRGAAHVPPQAVAAWPLLRSLGAGCAGFYAGARHGVARGGTHVLPQAAAAWPSLHSLDAGCAGFYAGACHGVARGGTCAASGGGGLAIAALAWRGLRRLYAGARHGVARGGTCAASGGGGLAAAALARRG